MQTGEITLRSITDNDLEFLFQVYASTRAEEKELVGWNDEQWEQSLRMQFHLQHTQYMRNYENPSFDIILESGVSAGRLYVNRGLPISLHVEKNNPILNYCRRLG